MAMLKQEFTSHFSFTCENKTITISPNILQMVLRELPLNEILPFSSVSRGAYASVKKLFQNYPTLYKTMSTRIGFTDSLALEINPSLESNEYLIGAGKPSWEGQSTDRYNFRCAEEIYSCGQLSLHERDEMAPYYLIDNRYHIRIYSPQTRELLTKLENYGPLNEQTIVALSRQTIVIGYKNGDIAIHHIAEAENKKKSKASFFTKGITHSSSPKTKSGSGLFSRLFSKRASSPSIEEKSNKQPPQHEQTAVCFSAGQSAIIALTAIDTKRFISADQEGNINFWHIEQADKHIPIKRWRVKEPVHALRYYDNDSILYATSHLLADQHLQVFSVIKFDGNTSTIQYKHSYGGDLFEPIPDICVFLARDRLSLIDRSEWDKKIVTIDHNSKTKKTIIDSFTLNPDTSQFKFCFFQGEGHIATLSDSNKSTARVEVKKHLTICELPSEQVKCFI